MFMLVQNGCQDFTQCQNHSCFGSSEAIIQVTTQALPNKAAACSAAWEFAGLMFRKEGRFAAAGSGKLNGHVLFAGYPPQLLG